MIRLYITLGIIAALALGGLALYAKGRIDARHAVELQTLKTQISVMEQEREREAAARKLDAIQAKLDREDAALNELKIQELEDALSDRDRACFDAGDADRLRGLINSKD